MIQFTCEHCGRRLRVADACAGKHGRCPQCRQVVQVPPVEAAPQASSKELPPPAVSPPLASPRDEDLLDLPLKPPDTGSPAPADAPLGSDTQEVVEDAPARFTDPLVYPANADGLVQIGVVALGLGVFQLLGPVLGRFVPLYGGVLVLTGEIIMLGYAIFYAHYCIYDSSRGGRRAATISLAHTPDLGDVVWQLLLLVAGGAICLWPAALYRGVAGRADVWFWVLGATGAFFLPMSLLMVTLFQGIDALNPVLITRSILVTLPAYVALLGELGLLAAAFLVIRWWMGQIRLPHVLATAAYLYLLLMGSHLLGRFYWRRKEKLGWGL